MKRGNRLEIKKEGKKEKTGDFSSIDPYKMVIAQEGE
jgi:hypothetical protein